jgi:long-chain acyl-CoA synthetase
MQLVALVKRVRAHPNACISTLQKGHPVVRTFADLARDIDAAVAELQQIGLARGQRVGCLTNSNCYEAIVYDLALVELRCTVVHLVPEVVADGLDTAAARFELALVIVLGKDDARPRETFPWVFRPGQNDARQTQLRPAPALDDPAFDTAALVFSSGTTGGTKCIATSTRGIEEIVRTFLAVFECGAEDNILLFLPMSNFQQRLLIYAALHGGVNLSIVDPVNLMLGLQRLSPTILLAPPALFDAIATRARRQATAARVLFALSDVATIVGAHRVGRALLTPVSRSVRKALGGKLRLPITGMAPSSLHTLRTFEQLGLPVFEAYGLTESGIIACNTPRARRLGSVGRPVPGVQVTIAEDGEVVVTRSALPTTRYLDPGAPNAAIYVAPGTVATGDIGHMDADGFLYLRGRKKNIIITAGGAKVHPELLEARIDACPSVARSVVLKAPTGTLISLIALESDDLQRRSEVTRFIARLNESLSPDSRIDRVEFSSVPFNTSTGILTANLKLDRRAVARHFPHLVA